MVGYTCHGWSWSWNQCQRVFFSFCSLVKASCFHNYDTTTNPMLLVARKGSFIHRGILVSYILPSTLLNSGSFQLHLTFQNASEKGVEADTLLVCLSLTKFLDLFCWPPAPDLSLSVGRCLSACLSVCFSLSFFTDPPWSSEAAKDT